MKFLDEASLPPDLQGATKGRAEKKATVPWLDHAKLLPLPVGDGWIDVDTALTLMHDDPRFDAALKAHSKPEALDRFVAELCRQLPNSEPLFNRYMRWRWIAQEVGGPETAGVLATRMTSKTAASMFRHGAAYALAEIGDPTHLPAMALCILRMDEGFYQTCVRERFAALARRLGIRPPDLEDWAMPDEGDPAEIAALRSVQPERLERAMLSGRRWTAETFDRRIVRQTVMAPLAAGLVWGYFDDAGRLLKPFVIGPGAEYPAPPAGASVGIVHPAHLAAVEAALWREKTKGIAAPFAQWKLPAQVLSENELAADQISKLPTIQIPAAALLCRLEGLGWQRPKTRTKLEFHTRAFADLGVTAVIRYSGIPLTYGGEWSDQSIVGCHFEANRQPLPLSRVSPIAISAVLGDLGALAGKPGARKR